MYTDTSRYIHIHISTHTHIYMHAHRHTYRDTCTNTEHVYIPVCRSIQRDTHRHTYVHTLIEVHIVTGACACTHTDMRAYISFPLNTAEEVWCSGYWWQCSLRTKADLNERKH